MAAGRENSGTLMCDSDVISVQVVSISVEVCICWMCASEKSTIIVESLLCCRAEVV